MTLKHFKAVDARMLKAPSEPRGCIVQDLGCGTYDDQPVCTNGNQDVSCTGLIYRGCAPDAWDCADCRTSNDNQSDKCCRGYLGPQGSDNIDHMFCYMYDAPMGGSCMLWETCWSEHPRCGEYYEPEW